MGNFRKKVSGILQTDFEREKLASIYLGKIISCTEKNIAHEVYNAEKNLTPLYVREKISNSRGFWKKFLPKLNHAPIPPLPPKSYMVNHIGGGKEADLTP